MTIDKLLQTVPAYDGKENPIEWLYKLEAGIEVYNLDPSSVVPFILLFLKGDAFIWYSTIMNYEIFEDMEDFRYMFIEWFTPPEEKVYNDLASYQWDDSMSFKKYILGLGSKFNSLKHLLDDIAKIQWFVRGLPKEWQSYFLKLKFNDYSKLCYHALQLDGNETRLPPGINENKDDITTQKIVKDLPETDMKDYSESNPLLSYRKSFKDIYKGKNQTLSTKATDGNSDSSKQMQPPKSISNKLLVPTELLTEFSSNISEAIDTEDSFTSIKDKDIIKNPRALSVVCSIEGHRVISLFYHLSFKASISLRCIQRLMEKGAGSSLNLVINQTGSNGKEENTIGTVKLKVEFNEITIEDEFLVLKDQSSDLLLGQRFMTSHSILLDLPLRRIKFMDEDNSKVLLALSGQLRNGLFF